MGRGRVRVVLVILSRLHGSCISRGIKISRKFKVNVLVSCVTLAYLYGRETMALTYNRGCRSARTTGSGGLWE